MQLLKCKMCGGDIELSSDKTTGMCDSCGCMTTLPKIDDEQRVGLFNRGNVLRMRGEFDKAALVFERIIEQGGDDAEAHWCLALCRYGIEYVEDPQSGERKPTCHRVRYDLFTSDMDCTAAIEHADSHAAGVYEAEANKIADIQKSILAISKQEKPFDVFICYKETTETGARTKDSALAQEIYYQLTNAGYHVFFSRITLEEKLGTEYEPYIFAALSSARVMVVLGTSAENFNAVWVKNEWSRFLSIMKTDRNRLLIPCYRDMDPYDLPDELAMLQSQDMGKIGFIQDITRGIRKVLDAGTPKADLKLSADVVSTSGVERLLRNGETYMFKLEDYAAAEETYKRITNEYPDDYRGWWGLIVCATVNLTVQLEDQAPLLKWLSYAKKMAPAGCYEPLEARYIEYTLGFAKLDAEKEMIIVQKSLNSLYSELATLERSCTNAENRKSVYEKEYDGRLVELNRDIAKAQGVRNAALKKERRGLYVIRTFLITLIAIGIVTFLLQFREAGNAGVGLLGVFLILLGMVIAGVSRAFVGGSYHGEDVHLANANAAYANRRLENYNKDYLAAVEEYPRKMANLSQRIDELKKKIADKVAYLELGVDGIAQFYLEKRCRAFGATVTPDSAMVELRKAAWDKGKGDPLMR